MKTAIPIILVIVGITLIITPIVVTTIDNKARAYLFMAGVIFLVMQPLRVCFRQLEICNRAVEESTKNLSRTSTCPRCRGGGCNGKFCERCGAKMISTPQCQCGAEIWLDWSYCRNCGRSHHEALEPKPMLPAPPTLKHWWEW